MRMSEQKTCEMWVNDKWDEDGDECAVDDTCDRLSSDNISLSDLSTTSWEEGIESNTGVEYECLERLIFKPQLIWWASRGCP